MNHLDLTFERPCPKHSKEWALPLRIERGSKEHTNVVRRLLLGLLGQSTARRIVSPTDRLEGELNSSVRWQPSTMLRIFTLDRPLVDVRARLNSSIRHSLFAVRSPTS